MNSTLRREQELKKSIDTKLPLSIFEQQSMETDARFEEEASPAVQPRYTLKPTVYLKTPKIKQLLRLLKIKETCESYRKQRIQATLENERKVVTQFDESEHDALVQSVQKYLDSKDYKATQFVREKVMRIPESKMQPSPTNFKKCLAPITQSKTPVPRYSEAFTQNKSTFILKRGTQAPLKQQFIQSITKVAPLDT